ncbi:MAG: BON domain-containing protein [Steroidobacterales bacterium]
MVEEIDMKTDIQLRHDVEAQLDWDPRFDSTGIGVAVKNGVIALSGHVGSYADRWAAQDAAQSVAGVKAIANELVVSLGSDAQRSDPEVAEAVLHALNANVSIPATAIKVVVHDGWVTLSGQVNFWYQREAAERTVTHLRGVKGLANDITIKPQASVADIKAKIEDAFRRHASLDANKIRVQTAEGTVTLEGEVNSWEERQHAEAAAWAAPGVSVVKDHLSVRS